MQRATATAEDAALLESVERVLDRHRPHPSPVGGPACGFCADIWPCPSVLSAQQAVVMIGAPRPALTDAPPRVPHPRTASRTA